MNGLKRHELLVPFVPYHTKLSTPKMIRISTFIFMLFVVLMTISGSAQAADMVVAKRTSEFLTVKHKYCNNAKYHCL